MLNKNELDELEKSIKYDFKVTRRNAIANPMLYGYKYTQKNWKDAKIEYLMDLLVNIIAQNKGGFNYGKD